MVTLPTPDRALDEIHVPSQVGDPNNMCHSIEVGCNGH